MYEAGQVSDSKVDHADKLDLSKIEAGKIDLNVEAADPLPILQGVRSTALGLVKKGVQLRVDYADELPLIMGDEVRVRPLYRARLYRAGCCRAG